jgi:hypothetical protein
MTNRRVRLAAMASILAGATIIGGSAWAAPLAPGALRTATDNLSVVQTVQFVWLGRNYCWYDDGWKGPGWYWCGQNTVAGIGWGGGYGWHNWRGGHPGGRPGYGRPGGGRPGGHPHVGRPGGRPAVARPAVGRPGGGRPGGGHAGGGRPGGGGHGGGGHGGGGHGGGGRHK